MHASRPVQWAKGTAFLPGFTDHGRISIKINIRDTGCRALYQDLTSWLERTAFPGATQSMNKKEADKLWKYITRYSTNLLQ
jgi:hypothetical protein